MPNGHLSSSAFPHNAASIGLSANIDGYVHDVATIASRASSGAAGSRAAIGATPIISVARDGWRSTGFVDLYYYRIWVIPTSIALGNVVADQTYEIEVWNAQFVDDTLTGVSLTGETEGFELDGLMSGAFPALHSEFYTASILTQGSTSIDIVALFEFASDTVSTYFFGQRVITFDLRHNWLDRVVEQISFKTDVMTGLSGREQRKGLITHPRRRIEMSYLTLTPRERDYLENVLYGWQGRKYAVPLWQDAAALTADAPIGSTTFQCDTVNRDFEEGSFVFLSDGTNHEIREVTGITATSITTAVASSHAFNSGARIVPARYAILEQKISAPRHTDQVDGTRLAWKLLANEVSTNRREAYTPETYRGWEVFNLSNDYSAGIGIEQSHEADVIDNETGVFDLYPTNDFPRRTYPFSRLLVRSELGEFVEWFYNRQGQLNPFWFNERVQSFFLTADALTTDVEIVVESNGYARLSSGSAARRDIAIKTSSGTWIYRHINDVEENGDGTETLILDDELGVELSAAANPMISFLKPVRLNQDMVELAYESSNAIRTATSYVDLLTAV